MHEQKILGESQFEIKDWSEKRKAIKVRFEKLSYDSIDELEDNIGLLSGKLQAVYGYSRVRADRESELFTGILPLADKYSTGNNAEMSRVPFFDIL